MMIGSNIIFDRTIPLNYDNNNLPDLTRNTYEQDEAPRPHGYIDAINSDQIAILK